MNTKILKLLTANFRKLSDQNKNTVEGFVTFLFWKPMSACVRRQNL